jgi:hypothetical protein
LFRCRAAIWHGLIWKNDACQLLLLAGNIQSLEQAERRPATSLLCFETVLSIVGHVMINLAFLAMAFVGLWQQDWFQCRKWGQSAVGNFQAIGDSYESSVLFLMNIFQTIATGMSMNFGYSFRQYWIKNYVFVCLSSFWMICVFVITPYPSNFSCVFRVNCSNEVSICTLYQVSASHGERASHPGFPFSAQSQNIVRNLTSGTPRPISNAFNTTVMPLSFRWMLVGIMISYLVAVFSW